jgi:ferric-chelate reductase [NAD(P)H]
MNEEALYKLNYGMYITTSKSNNKMNGQMANTVFQVTAEPPKIAVAINKKNFTHELILKSRIFAVSILGTKANLKFIGPFGFKYGRDIDKFEGVNYKIGKTGAPIVLDYTVAYLEAEVEETIDVGTHTLFVGKVVDGDLIDKGEPMTYEYYHQEIKGKEPETAPTYRKKKK